MLIRVRLAGFHVRLLIDLRLIKRRGTGARVWLKLGSVVCDFSVSAWGRLQPALVAFAGVRRVRKDHDEAST